jgi:hypothetical protein
MDLRFIERNEMARRLASEADASIGHFKVLDHAPAR